MDLSDESDDNTNDDDIRTLAGIGAYGGIAKVDVDIKDLKRVYIPKTWWNDNLVNFGISYVFFFFSYSAFPPPTNSSIDTITASCF